MKFTIALLGLLAVGGCAQTAKLRAWGSSHHVKQFSGGKLIGEWNTVGAVENEEHSDGFYFEDTETHRIVRISGDVQITVTS